MLLADESGRCITNLAGATLQIVEKDDYVGFFIEHRGKATTGTSTRASVLPHESRSTQVPSVSVESIAMKNLTRARRIGVKLHLIASPLHSQRL